MTIKQLIENIKTQYNEVLPDSRINVQYRTNLYPSISIKPYLAGDKKELSGGYSENDMLGIGFIIDTINGEFNRDVTLDTDIKDIKLVLTVTSKSYTIKPQSKYLVYSSNSLNFRKVKGNDQKIIDTLSKYFKTLKDSLKDSLENDLIHDNHKQLLIKKLG